KRILTEHRDELENLAQGLLEYETLTGPEIGRVMRGEPIGRDDDDADSPSSGTPSVASIPKTRGRKRGDEGDGGMEPEPSA
ncbi:MAG: cell division protein FtsH, partial [Alphaproteobacteria bacterium]|nr:cell division protein FtsH [Alphaproteobacteria bacterium]